MIFTHLLRNRLCVFLCECDQTYVFMINQEISHKVARRRIELSSKPYINVKYNVDYLSLSSRYYRDSYYSFAECLAVAA